MTADQARATPCALASLEHAVSSSSNGRTQQQSSNRDTQQQLSLAIRTPPRPLTLSITLRSAPVEKYRLSKDGRKWKPVARDRMHLAQFLATHGDGDGSRIWVGEASMTRHFGWCRRKTFKLLADLAELELLFSTGLTSEHGTRVRRMDLKTFLGEQECIIRVPGVQNSRAGVHSNDAHNRHLTERTEVQNLAAQTAASSAPPFLDSKRQSPTPQKIRFDAIGKLARGAEYILRSLGNRRADADSSECLKQWAASNRVLYDADAISKAFDIAERRIRGTVTGTIARAPEKYSANKAASSRSSKHGRLADELNQAIAAHVGSREPFNFPKSLRDCDVRLQAEIMDLAKRKRVQS